MAVTARMMANGDRRWSEAAVSTLADRAATVRNRSKDIGGSDVEAVHDMRTATRRLRTSITIYGSDADKEDRKPVERELKRVARRLGTVRDLDVLLETLAKASNGTDGAEGAIQADDLRPLRDAWEREREDAARRLKVEIGRPRFGRALDHAARLAASPRDESGNGTRATGAVRRIADRAPGLIWTAFGALLAYDLDPATADPAAIHEMRIDAKKLRYTLEAFEDALEPGSSLIAQVTALQDAGGEMHDAIVARDRARSTIGATKLRAREQAAIEAFADAQDRRAETRRPIVAQCLAAVRSRAFRESLGRAVAGMGHVTARS